MTEELEEDTTVSVFILKLRTGELLMSEVVVDNEDDDIIHLMSPISIDQDVKNQRFSFSEWIIPFLATPFVSIHQSDVILMEEVSPNYVKVYGSFISQIIINQIKAQVAENMTSDTQYYDIQAAVEKIRQVSKEMSVKFDIPEIDLTDFEQESEKFKPLVH